MRRGGVRVWATLAATIVVSLGLVLAAVLLVSLTRSALVDSVRTSVATRSADLAELAAAGTVPVPIPLRDAISAQVIAASGAVVVSTPDIAGQAPVTRRRPVSAGSDEFTVPSLDGDEGGEPDDEGPYAVAVTVAEAPGGKVAVVAASSLAHAEDAADALAGPLFVGVPSLVALVAGTTWILVGRALRPVRAMTEEADRITASRLDRRIPVPYTGDEIGLLGTTLNSMLDRLDASVKRQRQLVADASHELKSPVASLLTMAEVAGATPGWFSVSELAADVAAEARRLALLVDDLLTLARSDEGRFDLEIAPVDLAQVVSEQVAGHPWGGFDVTGLASIVVPGDHRRLGQVVRNLLDNAARHASRTVWVETGERDGDAVLVVADDGPGIPPAERSRIFERFVRLDDARSREEGGTGLGLSVVRAIVEGHGGSVRVVDDDRFPGAVFAVTLPREGR